MSVIYFMASLIGILHHELWLDESQHWLLARDSSSLADLIENTRYEGHPILWNVLLFAITRLTLNPFWMQFLHILFSTAVVVLFLKKAPFSWLFKSLFIFGYFIFFEYNLISRNYILGILFLFLACAAFKNREKNFIWISIFLAMAVNIHLMFSVIAFALFLTLLLENIENRRLLNPRFLIGYLIFGLGMLSIILQIQHTNSSWLLDPINAMPFEERLAKGLGALFKGLITIPDWRTIHFWNSNFIVNACRPLSALLALLIYFVPLLLFFKNRKTLYFVYSGLIGTELFFFITQRAATRFHGMTFILIIMALWIEHYYCSEDFRIKKILQLKRFISFKNPIVNSILILQFCSGIYAYTMDCIYPFTSSKAAVDFIKKEGLANREIITTTCDGTLISAYLERKIYFLCDASYQSFCHWDNGCNGSVSREKSLELLNNFMNSHENAIFVSYYSLTGTLKQKVWVDLNNHIRVRLLKKFDENIVDKTSYYVFEIAKIKI